VALNGLNS